MKNYWKHTLIATLLIVLAAITLTGCGKQKIDLQDCVEVTISGADGYGKARATLDEDSLLALIHVNEDNDESLGSAFATLLLLDEIDVDLDITKGLSNGDKVKVTVTYPDNLAESLDAKISPKSGGTWTVKVSDLPEVQEVDLFDDFSVFFAGYDGYGKAEVQSSSDYGFKYTLSQTDGLSNGDTVTLTIYGNNVSDLESYCIENYGFVPIALTQDYTVSGLNAIGTVDLFEDIEITPGGTAPRGEISVTGKYDGISYSCSPNGSLSNGDTVTITAVADAGWFGTVPLEDYCIENLGALPESNSYTYTVEGLSYYVTSISAIPETLLASMQEQAEDEFTTQAADDGEITLNNAEYLGCYLLVSKDLSNSWNDSNQAYLIYRLCGIDADGAFEVYSFVKFVNLMVYGDGTPYTDLNNYSRPGYWSGGGAALHGYKDLANLANDHVDSQRGSYTVETDIE